MAYFENKQIIYKPRPVPSEPSYNPPTPPIPPSVEDGSEPVNPRPSFSGECVLKIYKNHSENNMVNKFIDSEIDFNISLKENVDIISPIIILESDIDLLDYNYAYIDVTDRYYYFTAKLLTGNLYQLELTEDYLMSFKDDILKLTAIINKQEVINNMYIDDGSFVMQSNEINQVINFPNGFNNNPEFILICCGG